MTTPKRTLARHDADLLRERHAARRPRLHDDRRRRPRPRAAPRRARRVLPDRAPTSTGRTSSGSRASAGSPEQEHCDRISAAFRALWDRYDIRYDRFIRTTDDVHRRGVLKLWERLRGGEDPRRPRRDLPRARYAGWYCPRCEAFKDEDELRQPGNVCPDHERPCEWTEEENFFFRLSAYEAWLQARDRERPPADPPRVAAERDPGRDPPGPQGLQRQPRAGEVGDPGPRAARPRPLRLGRRALSNYITALGYADDAEAYRHYWAGGDERLHLHRQGHHPLPLPVLAGHPARGRRAGADARVRAGLHHEGRPQALEDHRQRHRPGGARGAARARRRALLPAARGALRGRLGLHRRAPSSAATTPTSPTTSATSSRAR